MRRRRSPSSATAAGRASIWSRVENTPARHNLVVCTLCSCYPWPVLGLPPVWYKSPPYRSRAVIDPRGVLAEFGVELPKETEIRVWDSTAEIRYLVIPDAAGRNRRLERGAPRVAGHARQHDRRRPRARAARRRSGAMNGAQDLGGMMGFGPIAPETERAAVSSRMGKARARDHARRGRLRALEPRRFPPRARDAAARRISEQELL